MFVYLSLIAMWDVASGVRWWACTLYTPYSMPFSTLLCSQEHTQRTILALLCTLTSDQVQLGSGIAHKFVPYHHSLSALFQSGYSFSALWSTWSIRLCALQPEHSSRLVLWLLSIYQHCSFTILQDVMLYVNYRVHCLQTITCLLCVVICMSLGALALEQHSA